MPGATDARTAMKTTVLVNNFSLRRAHVRAGFFYCEFLTIQKGPYLGAAAGVIPDFALLDRRAGNTVTVSDRGRYQPSKRRGFCDRQCSGTARPNSSHGSTRKQGQYLAFIYVYAHMFHQPPAEADRQRHFRVTPPSVHQMVVALERDGLISRQPTSPEASPSSSHLTSCRSSNSSS